MNAIEITPAAFFFFPRHPGLRLLGPWRQSSGVDGFEVTLQTSQCELDDIQLVAALRDNELEISLAIIILKLRVAKLIEELFPMVELAKGAD